MTLPMRLVTPLTMRAYQTAAIEAINRELATNRSTLLVMATGTGKTAVAAGVIAHHQGHVLWLAHREELIRQAAARIERDTGKVVGIEKATETASLRDDVIVASIQTISRSRRLDGYPSAAFDLIIVDEAHHAPADSYREVLRHFPDAKVLGLTATPDRSDRKAMGALFDSVAFVYDIENAIKDGYLCPIRAMTVKVDDLSLVGVRTTAGDLNLGDLNAAMTDKSLLQIAQPTIELAAERRTLVFTPGVEKAHRLADIMCMILPGCAMAVDGATDSAERRRIIADHQAGAFQFLVNCGVFTEGYDDPKIACVAIARPTKSRALHCQMSGRGTRTAPGKADLLLLDFVGNCGKHSLASAVDILAGRFPEDVTERAKRIVARQPGIDLVDALGQAEKLVADEKAAAEAAAKAQAERERRIKNRRVIGTVKYNAYETDPFKALGMADPAEQWGGQFGRGKLASEKQLALMKKMKIQYPHDCTAAQASKLIGEQFRRRKTGLCSIAQATTLARFGYPVRNLSFEAARRLLDMLAQNCWRPIPLDRSRAITSREPGSDDVAF